MQRLIAAGLGGLTRCGLGLLLATAVGLGAPVVAQAGLNVWTTAGPEGGSVKTLAVDLQTAGVVYAGSRGGSVFKSTTGGSFWTRVLGNETEAAGLPVFLAINVLAIGVNASSDGCAQIPGTLYAGGDDGVVFKSTDGGASWTPSRGIVGVSILSLAIDPQTPTTLYAGTDGRGVFKSIDGGATWLSMNNGLGDVASLFDLLFEALAIDPRTPATLYAGASDVFFGGTVFKSTNGGATWSRSLSGTGGFSALVIDPKTPTTIYAGTRGDGVFKSNNGGGAWSSSNAGLPQQVSVPSLVIDAEEPDILFAGTSRGVFKSNNGGVSWNPSSSGLTNTFVTALAIDAKAPSSLYVGALDGVSKSSNGGASWSPRNSALADQQVTALAGDPQRPAILYAGTGTADFSFSFLDVTRNSTVFKSTTGGASWTSSGTGLPNKPIGVITVSPQDPATLYAATTESTSGEVYKSTNAGASWNRTALSSSVPVRAVAIDPEEPATVYTGTRGGVFKTTDAGASSSPRNTGLTNLDVRDLAIDPGTPATLYAATAGGVFKSTDSGTEWKLSNALRASRLVIDPGTLTTLYAATTGGVFKSMDGGATWSARNSGLPANVVVSALAVDPRTPATVYVGVGSSGAGVFKSTDGGASWSQINTGLRGPVSSLLVNATGRCLHAGSAAGVFQFATRLDSDCLPPPPLVAAVLPASRSVQVDTVATAFASMINGSPANAGTMAADGVGTGSVEAVTCGITQLTGLPTPFTFRATDPRTNEPIGLPNTPVNIPAGGNQTFVISLTPTAGFGQTDVQFGFNCTNTGRAPTVVGLNTLLFTASCAPVPDIVALAATLANDGIVNVPGDTGTGVFAVATSNVGAGASITASADTGAANLAINISLCQTNPVSGSCLTVPSNTVTTQISANATPSFGIFVTGVGPIVPFDPANNRVFVRFKDAGGMTRGSTSVAVRTQ